MKALLQLFKKHQLEITRLKSAMAEGRVRSIATCRHKITLLKSQSISLRPNPLEIRNLVGYCETVEDYLFITMLYYQTGNKNHSLIVYDTLLQKLDRASDLILIGKQMINFGLNGAYSFFTKASTRITNPLERILVDETFANAQIGYGNVA
jgi:hypothetical protein